MPKIYLDWTDGRYYTRQLNDAEVAEHEAHGLDVVYIEDTVWETYRRDSERDGIWQAFWRSISNEQAMRRREKELMPLEDAEREIRRLRDDLAQAKRMWTYFEGLDAAARTQRHRAAYIEFTCVFPQPGCDVTVLPPKWRDQAEEILEHYNEAHAAKGMKVQGCCCGNEHEKLDEATSQQLRDKGFLIEHDSEPA
jgi:hypothetical protein